MVAQAGLCLTWSKTPKTGFILTWLIWIVVYGTDRSKAAFLVFLLCVALWFLLRVVSMIKLILPLVPNFYSVLFGILITSLWEEIADLYDFSLPFCIRGWLRLVTVKLPGLFNKNSNRKKTVGGQSRSHNRKFVTLQ